jgi:hypothetical protein
MLVLQLLLASVVHRDAVPLVMMIGLILIDRRGRAVVQALVAHGGARDQLRVPAGRASISSVGARTARALRGSAPSRGQKDNSPRPPPPNAVVLHGNDVEQSVPNETPSWSCRRLMERMAKHIPADVPSPPGGRGGTGCVGASGDRQYPRGPAVVCRPLR